MIHMICHGIYNEVTRRNGMQMLDVVGSLS